MLLESKKLKVGEIMSVNKLDDIDSRIKTYLNESINLSPYSAEKKIGNILSDLLEIDGYELSQSSAHSDKGFDFVAKSKNPTNEDDIGIEYKHYISSVGANVINKLVGTSRIRGFSRCILLTNSNFTATARSMVLEKKPIKVDLMDISDLLHWSQRIRNRFETESDSKDIEVLIYNLSTKFAKIIANNPDQLYKLEWRDIERMMAAIFDGLGFDVTLTPPSKDGGKDLILECLVENKYKSYIVEIKHWKAGSRVGYKAIKEFINVVVNEKRESGLYLSTSGYCSNAFESLTEVERKLVNYGGKDKIISLCKSYDKISSGIWTRRNDLNELLLESTI